MIPYGRQDITQEDVDAVVSVLQSDFLTQGPAVPEFERLVQEYVGVNHGVAVNSATSALHLACLALGVGEGDLVWTTPITFVASANCALYCGAEVDFVDIDPKTYNLCPNKLREKLEYSKAINRLPKVLIPVHLCGQSCDMAAIWELSQEFGFRVIEDASHAIGGRYKTRFIGSCEYSDITVFSFHPVKIVTTAEGGMAVTNSDELFERLSLLRSHGVTRDVNKMTHEPDGDWYYQQIDLGFNYRMTELQGALGASQMSRLEQYVNHRQSIAKRYDQLLNGLPLVLPWQDPDTSSATHLYVVRLKLPEIRLSHREVFDALRDEGVGVNLHYIPVHTQPYYQEKGFNCGDYPEAECYYREALSLPVFHTMTYDQQDSIVSALNKVLL